MTTEVEKIYDPLVGRTVGSGECGALTSDYMLRMTGGKYQWAGEPGGGQLPPGTIPDSAWTVYTTTNWGAIGFEKIDNPSFSQVREGDMFFTSPAKTGIWSGHTGIVANTYNNNITTFEQNYTGVRVVQKMPGQNSWSVYSGFDGIVRKKGNSSTPSPGGQYTGGSLTNAGNTISQDNIRLVISSARKYNIKPSFLIAQMFVESHWGNPNISAVGSIDNNWSGISEPFRAPAELGISMSRGTARPSNEGGYYVHFTTMGDFFKAYSFILSKSNGLYNVEGATTIEAYCKGLFRVGGANADYAASGYEHYLSMLVPTYNAINQQNLGKLQLIDSSNDDNNNQEGEEDEMIKFKVIDGGAKGTKGYLYNGRFIVGGATGDSNVVYHKLTLMESTGKITPIYDDISSGEYQVLCSLFPSHKNNK